MDIQVHVIPMLHNMILVWISVIILFFILRHFLYKPVKELLAKRQNYVTSQISEADTRLAEAESIKREYQEKMDRAKEEGVAIVESYKTRGEEIQKRMVAEAQEEAKQIIQRAQREIIRQQETALSDMKNQALDMGLLVARKALETGIGKEEQEKLIDGFIEGLGDKSWLN